ncbi:MAG: amino acid ABC transporter substrate-binding protein [Acidimicrobiia bacterium]|nr:amino acid ABC transporter substrate-binding protein [Acidimicrobiia bacterium]
MLGVALAATACGQVRDAAPTVEDALEVFDGTVTFGAPLAASGPRATEGGYVRDGFDVAQEIINASGGIGIDGRHYRVEIVYVDDESDPESSARAARTLVEDEDVDFLLGPYGSSATAAVSEYVESARIPLVAANGTASSIYTHENRYTFGVASPADQYLADVIDTIALAAKGRQRVALISETDTFAADAIGGAEARALASGWEVVYRGTYPAKAEEFVSEVTALREAGPDVILGAGHLSDTMAFVQQARGAGVEPMAWGFAVGPNAPEFRSQLGTDADYVLGAAQWTESMRLDGDALFGTPAEFAARVRASTGRYGGEEVPYHVAQSAASLLVYKDAIERVGTVEPEAVRLALTRTDLDTFFGRIKFDYRQVNVFKSMAAVQNGTDGQLHTVGPRVAAERPIEFPVPAWAARSTD